MADSTAISKTADARRAPRVCRGVPSVLHGAYGFGSGAQIVCTLQLEPPATICAGCAEEIERRSAASDARHAAEALRKRLEAANLPAPFVSGTKTLDTLRALSTDHVKWIGSLREWLNWETTDGCRLNVLVRGGAGLGKTHGLQGAIREAIIAGERAMYTNARDLALKLQGSFRDHAKESTEEILDRFTRPNGPAHFLALDDIGATKPTRFISDAFYTLLDRRAQNELPTLVSTNYERLSDLAERLLPSDGDALDAIRPVDRLEELAPITFTLRGESQRSKVNRGRDAQIPRGDE